MHCPAWQRYCVIQHSCCNTNETIIMTLTQWRRKVVKSEEARTSEAQRAEAGGGVLGEGAASPPPHQLGVWGSAVSSPSGVRGEAPAEIDFCVFLIPQKASSTTLFGHNRNVTF